MTVAHEAANRELTVSCNTFTPAGVASRIATRPIANMPAASLKSRRKARTIEAIAKPSAIMLIATLRPVSPALAAADSREPPPSAVVAISAWMVWTVCIVTPLAWIELVTGSQALTVGVGLDRGHLPASGDRDDIQFVAERVLRASSIARMHDGQHRAALRRPIETVERPQPQGSSRQGDARTYGQVRGEL